MPGNARNQRAGALGERVASHRLAQMPPRLYGAGPDAERQGPGRDKESNDHSAYRYSRHPAQVALEKPHLPALTTGELQLRVPLSLEFRPAPRRSSYGALVRYAYCRY